MFGFNRKKSEFDLGAELADFIVNALLESDGRVRAEDLLVGSASIAAERIIELAGDYNPRVHEFAPGQRVFSDRVNELLVGDITSDDWRRYPRDSACGMLLVSAMQYGYELSDFPSMKGVFERFAAATDDEKLWGTVPFSVPEDNLTRILPLRFEFETRAIVDELFRPTRNDRRKNFVAAMHAVCVLLERVEKVIKHSTALTLVVETLAGMSKTAPMTKDAMLALVNEVNEEDPDKPKPLFELE